MPCYHPSVVRVARKVRPSLRVGDEVPVPLSRSDGSDEVTVPCGHCLGCRTNQAQSWAVRLVHEAQVRDGAWFATLTYNDRNLPQHGSLDPEGVRLFLGRLRKKFPPKSLSYYLCGEYGESNQRPHYHAVLLGPRFLDRDRLPDRDGTPLWASETLERAWGLGFVELTTMSYNAAAYVAGYVRKKIRHRDEPEAYDRVDPETGEIVGIEREFARMSRRPAIGKRWIERYWRDVYPSDFVVMDGREVRPPRYYDKWMDEHQPLVMEEVRHQRWLDAEEIGDEKLIMKERVHRARVALFQGRDRV